ncbi:MAG: diguanylate cyclase [Deltaproteobacteria bacterium]|nr:diguanylate cyclase [Deltaproteobacteria bacterium]
MRVLIARDLSSSPQLRKQIEARGHDCLEVGTAADALSFVTTFNPDLVLCDWSVIGGTNLCDELKAMERERPIWVLAMTTEEAGLQMAALEGGADDVLAQPFDEGSLAARLLVAERADVQRRQLRDKILELERISAGMSDDGQRDPLTRVGSRARLEEDLAALCDRAVRYGHKFSVGFCDIDHFSAYNDVCGRAAGDNALRAIARSMASGGRLGDTAYRYGGDELMVVLPEAIAKDALRAMDRRRKAVEKLQIPNPASPSQGVLTVSVGVAAFDRLLDRPVEAMIAAALRGVEAARGAGRNVVRSASGEGPTPPGK